MAETDKFKGYIEEFIDKKIFGKNGCKCAQCKEKNCKKPCEDKAFEYKIYNEFSLQHELGQFLSQKGYKIFYEKNVKEFLSDADAEECVKKEVDIIAKKGNKKYAIELKFPKNGQYPEEMFQFLKDIRFMEQIKTHWEATQTYCLTLVNNKNFYEGSHCENNGEMKNYRYFRNSKNSISSIQGRIKNHIAKKNYKGQTISEIVVFEGKYSIKWKPEKSDKNLCYYFLSI